MNFIDLFAGAGGLSEGFIRAGFTPLAHVESDSSACYTLKTRACYHYLKKQGKIRKYYNYLDGKISRNQLYESVPEEEIKRVINEYIDENTIDDIIERIEALSEGKKIHALIGGPPCQAYSLVGRARDEKKMKSDPRNYLYKYYARILRHFKPEIFVFENVKGLLSAGGGVYLEHIKRIIRKSGYNLEVRKLNARDFGVLQNRERLIIIGWKEKLNLNYPEFENTEITGVEVEDLLSDLPFLNAGESYHGNYFTPGSDFIKKTSIRNGCPIITQHVARDHTEQDKEIYRIAVRKWEYDKSRLKYHDLPDHLITHNNTKSFLDRFKVVAKDLPYSHTVVAHISKDGHYYIHPDENQCRSLSVREAARIQSFPDDYYFEGVKENIYRTPAFRQIGNAVPPLMAGKIAEKIKVMLQL